MTGVLGRAALFDGVLVAGVAAYLWMLVARTATDPQGRPHRRAAALARLATWGMLVSAIVAVAALEWALLSHDFSISYVAENGGRGVPTYYTAISLWAALEGSLLLWLLVLTGIAVAVMLRPHRRAGELQPWAMAVIAAVAAFFFGLASFAGNPFETVSPVPADGPGPNPLLQDHPLMGVHPPLLYLGFVGMTVPFAYAVAALLTGRTGAAWVAVTRRWTLFAWTCLTVAIVMGGWWAYEVLGWGGYWAWDPVENASIMPWFTATALLHSMLAQARRPTLRAWNLALALATFLLVLVGTFLTRSGVVQSVHSFTQSAIGPVLLGFIVVVLLASGALFVLRADRLGPDEGLGGRFSRESVFLGNNVLLVALALTVLVGTVFPLLVEAIDGSRISVGAPYFDRVAVPLALAIVLLMGIGPLVPWGQANPRALARRLRVPALVGLAVTGALAALGLDGVTPLLTFGLAGFTLTAIAVQFGAGITAERRNHPAGWLSSVRAEWRRRRRFYGGLIVHAGVVLMAVGVAASQNYSSDAQARLSPGETVAVSGYTARFEGLSDGADARKEWTAAELTLSRGGDVLGTYAPALNVYPSATQAIGTPAVRGSLTVDVYLVLAEADPATGQAVISIAIRPLVPWIWVASGVMALGAIIAGWPARHTRRRTGPPDRPEPDLARSSP